MEVGKWVQTPRFCGVRISEVFSSEADARAAGYTEPTYYQGTNGECWESRLTCIA